MSNRSHRRRARPVRLDRPLIDQMAQAAAHAAGCTCRPEVRVRHDEGAVTLAHDDDCPATTARSVIVIAPRSTHG